MAFLEAVGSGSNGGTNDFNAMDFSVDNNEVSLTPAQRTFTGTTAEWEALTAEQKALYGTVQLTDDEGAEYKDIYSTSEVKTNKEWIDGKPIYRKVFTGLSILLSGDGRWHDTVIDAPQDASNIIHACFLRSEMSSDQHRAFINTEYTVAINNTSNKIAYATVCNWSTGFSTLILEYTKTTD